MKETTSAKSRRRSRSNLDKKILVYFSKAERDLIDKAANAERRSISSFVASAAIDTAGRLLAKHQK